MADKLRVVHYINQFFAQLGGEESASMGIEVREGPVGPGLMLAEALGDSAEVVATIICGDNHIAENLEAVSAEVFDIIKSYSPDLFFAGPAFGAGRYGVACGQLCKLVKNGLGIPAVTGMFAENPGVDIYRGDLFIVKTGDNARRMATEVPKLVELAQKLLRGETPPYSPDGDYYERGWKILYKADKLASTRMVYMLLDKLAGRPYETEVFLPERDPVPRAPAVGDLSKIKLAFATDGGLYPASNPDNMPPQNPDRFCHYPYGDAVSFNSADYTIVHNGFDKSFLLEDPNRIVPLDALRELEAEGRIGLFPEFLSTTGLLTNIANSTKIGRAMASYAKEHNIGAVVLTST